MEGSALILGLFLELSWRIWGKPMPLTAFAIFQFTTLFHLVNDTNRSTFLTANLNTSK